MTRQTKDQNDAMNQTMARLAERDATIDDLRQQVQRQLEENNELSLGKAELQQNIKKMEQEYLSIKQQKLASVLDQSKQQQVLNEHVKDLE